MTGIVLDTGGSGYPSGPVWVMVDAPAQQAIISPTIVSGSVSALTVFYGGSGHVVAPELVILGTGTGASATTVLTADVVTGTTGLVGGSGYTGTHPIAVGVAPPPRQAIGTVLVVGGFVNSGTIVDPGCGYPNTPPLVAIVGAGSGGKMTAAMVLPTSVYVTTREAGCVPYETAAGFNASLPGSGCWINTTMASTADLVTLMITSTANYLPSGQQIWVENVNEHWNDGFPFGAYYSTVGQLIQGSLGTSTGDAAYIRDALFSADTAWKHELCETYLTSIGRGNDLVRVYGSWAASDGLTANMVSYCNQFNKRIDAVCIGPYWQIPLDSCLAYAMASIIPDIPHSIAAGTSWPWTRAMAHDLLRNLIVADARFIGSGTGGAPLGYFQAHHNALAKYTLKSGQTTPPVLVAYEAAISQFIASDIAPGYKLVVNSATFSAASCLEKDLFSDPGMYDTGMAFFLMQETGGLYVSNYFQATFDMFFPQGPSGGNTWFLVAYEGQQPGMGDGSDGKAVSTYWMDANTIPGAGSTAAKYTTFFDRYNPAPLMQAFIDFGAGATTNPLLTVFPGSVTVAPGGSTSITATLTNSTASLTASALHGTVPGSVTSGVAFNYTAPSSGFASDVATVSDATDSIAATCAITITPTPTPTPTVSVLNTAYFGGRAYGTVAFGGSSVLPTPTPTPTPIPWPTAPVLNTAYFGGRAYGTVAFGGSSIPTVPTIRPGRYHSVFSTPVLVLT